MSSLALTRHSQVNVEVELSSESRGLLVRAGLAHKLQARDQGLGDSFVGHSHRLPQEIFWHVSGDVFHRSQPFMMATIQRPVKAEPGPVSSSGEAGPFLPPDPLGRRGSPQDDFAEPWLKSGLRAEEQEDPFVPDEESLPRDEENLPHDEESLPCDEESLPRDEESLPRDEESLPRDEESLPCDEESLPRDEESLPRDEESLPRDEESLPRDEESLPHDEESLPRDEETLPRDEETLPRDEESLPRDGVGSRRALC
jgi:hypothetical protein